jgi:RNA polymerase sigma-70 factor (ECF subfamily)
MTALVLQAEDQRWVEGLMAGSRCFEQTCRELHSVLLRAARYEIRRRGVTMRVSGPEADYIACQAASDALLLIIAKVSEFRGDSKFTTWTSRFASLEVRAKLRQHLSRQDRLAPPPEHWDYLTDPVPGPDQEVEARDLARSVRDVVDACFTRVQRAAFAGVVLSGDSPETVAVDLGTSANAVHQAIFRARRSLRKELAISGFLP